MLSEVELGKKIQVGIIDFTMTGCPACGIPFFVPTDWFNNKRNDHRSFSCPNGHGLQLKSKSEIEKLREVIQEKEKREQNITNRLMDEMNKSKKLELKLSRIGNGICPCCNRYFANLHRHVKAKHPELSK